MDSQSVHVSVLPKEIVHWLSGEGPRVLLDTTLGGGGHTARLLESNPGSFVVANDQDAAAIERAKVHLAPFGARCIVTHGNYSSLKERIAELSIPWLTAGRFQGILMDLGLSSDQLQAEGRGFSYERDEPLDMRMDETSSLTAATVLNTYSPRQLKRMFARGGLGPERNILVSLIIGARPLETTLQFAELCRRCIHKRQPAALPFQAVRIEVNQELTVLEDFLDCIPELLAPAGRLAVISFHSLEDKVVAQWMRRNSRPRQESSRLPNNEDAFGRLLTKRAVTPSDEEIAMNPRSRSALLRVFERNTDVHS